MPWQPKSAVEVQPWAPASAVEVPQQGLAAPGSTIAPPQAPGVAPYLPAAGALLGTIGGGAIGGPPGGLIGATLGGTAGKFGEQALSGQPLNFPQAAGEGNVQAALELGGLGAAKLIGGGAKIVGIATNNPVTRRLGKFLLERAVPAPIRGAVDLAVQGAKAALPTVEEVGARINPLSGAVPTGERGLLETERAAANRVLNRSLGQAQAAAQRAARQKAIEDAAAKRAEAIAARDAAKAESKYVRVKEHIRELKPRAPKPLAAAEGENVIAGKIEPAQGRGGTMPKPKPMQGRSTPELARRTASRAKAVGKNPPAAPDDIMNKLQAMQALTQLGQAAGRTPEEILRLMTGR